MTPPLQSAAVEALVSADAAVLIPPKADALDRCEAEIAKGMKSFAEAGRALREIRDGKLYRESHKTFELYCKKRWGFSRNYANKMIAAAVVVGNLGTNVPAPKNEAQARHLTKLPATEQPAAWTEATEAAKAAGREPTASDVEKVVAKRIPEESLKTEPQPHPPCMGLEFARAAVSDLEEIKSDDEQRLEAFQYVQKYCTKKIKAEKIKQAAATLSEDEGAV